MTVLHVAPMGALWQVREEGEPELKVMAPSEEVAVDVARARLCEAGEGVLVLHESAA